ncbi:MAG: cyclase family protein [Ktedonobacteraceae bacterium]|nr:cyclase family protein [Ktedonobacteraceae bacterium]
MRIVDLTQHLDNDMPLYPGMPRPSFVDRARVETDGHGMSEWNLMNHIGTHIDAPSHLVIGPTLDDMPLERLVTEAVVLDFSQHARGPLAKKEITPHLDRIQPGNIVLIYSGGSRHWGTEQYWTGWCYPDAEAAQALIERNISAIGFDGPSADPVDTTTFDLHRLWLSSGRLILENMTNIDQLPERTLLVVAPLKVRNANGAPARIFALLS